MTMDHMQVRASNTSGTAGYTERVDGARVVLMREWIHEALTNHTQATLLDVGCADGGISGPFREKARLVGIDINASFVAQAAERGMETHVVDFESGTFPLPPASVHVVVCGETIEHVVNTDWFMCQINRVMKIGAHAVFSVPNTNQLISYPMTMVFDRPPRYSARFRSPHVRDFTLRTAKQCFREFGFEVIKVGGTGFYVPPFPRTVVKRLARRFPRLAAEHVFLLRKKVDVAFDATKVIDFG
jgi:SAM-dependent methyltransferase